MFINWTHYLIPKLFFILSYIANPVFVYLISTENKFPFGDYKYLLYFFASFNMLSSLVDVLVPIGVFTYKYATVVFLADGFFEKRSLLGDFMVPARIAFIAGTYGVLNSHFVYRFLSLRYNWIIVQYFNPYGLILAFYWVLFHWAFWEVVNFHAFASVPEMRGYVKEAFEENFGVNIDSVNMKMAVFEGVSPELIRRSWKGTICETVLAGYSISLYLFLGYKIMSGLNKGFVTMSNKTLQIQRRLFWALAIQTFIPVCVSFAPCAITLYGSAFSLDFLSPLNWVSSVAISTFSFLDPLAIMLCLPPLRDRLFFMVGIDLSKVLHTQVHSITSF